MANKIEDAIATIKAGSSTTLTLYKKNIGDAGAISLADVLKENSVLRELYLGKNNIGDPGVRALADALKENRALSKLSLHYNNIGDTGAELLVDALKENPVLKVLYLGRNKIGDVGAKFLADALKENRVLRELYLVKNNIDATGAEALADALKENEVLTELHLQDNHIGDTGAGLLANALKENRVLTSLMLGRNNIGDTGAALLLKALETNYTLIELYLSYNDVTEITVLDRIDSLLKRNKGLAKECHDAAKVGDTQKCLALLEQGVSPYAIREIDGTEGSNSFLHWAVLNGHTATVKALLKYYQEHGYQVLRRNIEGLTPQQLAEKQGNRKIIALFPSSSSSESAAEDSSASVVPVSDDNGTLSTDDLNRKLTAAVRAGDVAESERLLARGANLHAKDAHGRTARVLAAKRGHQKIVDLINAEISKNRKLAKVDSNTVGRKSFTSSEIQTDVNGGKPLARAAQFGKFNEVVRLVNTGTSIHYVCNKGWTVLMRAASNGHLPIVKFFLSKKADVNAQNCNGDTALGSASHGGHHETAKYLCEQGADTAHRTKSGFTALMAAAKKGYANVFHALFTDETYSLINNEADNVFHIMAASKNSALLKSSLQRYPTQYAQIHLIKNDKEETPTGLAIKHHPQIIKAFLLANKTLIQECFYEFECDSNTEVLQWLRDNFPMEMEACVSVEDNSASTAASVSDSSASAAAGKTDAEDELSPDLTAAIKQLAAGTSTTIELFSKNIDAVGAGLLAEALKRNQVLSLLDLNANKIGAIGASSLAEALKENPALRKLYLGGNKIGVVGTASLSEALKKNRVLMLFDFSGNDIGNRGAKLLAEALKENSVLRRLHLSLNKIGARGISSLAGALKKNRALRDLHLIGNKINDIGAEALAGALKVNRVLALLNLKVNNISAGGAGLLLEALESNYTLTQLDLSDNNITDKTVLARIDKCLKRNRGLAQECHDAAKAGEAEKCLELLEQGVSPYLETSSDEGEERNTVLHWAVLSGHAATAKALFEYYQKQEYSIDVKSLKRLIPPQLAEERGGRDIIDLFSSPSNAEASAAADKADTTAEISPKVTAAIEQLKTGTVSMLDLHGNNIGDSDAALLSGALRKNSVLTKLVLWDNNIGDAGAASLAVVLKVNDVLTTLVLWDNKIGDKGATLLADALTENQVLRMLDLSQNNIGDAGAGALADALKKNRVLRELSLHCNDIGDTGAELLADALTENPVLRKFYLGRNKIGDVGARFLANVLKENPPLEMLDLEYNQIGATGAEALAEALKKNQVLRELNLQNNHIAETGAEALADVLKENQVLRELNLDSNNIGGPGAGSLADALKENQVLTTLNLSNNNIDVTGTKFLADALKENQVLRTLDLARNNIGTTGVESLADALKENRALRMLNLWSNNIDDADVEVLANALKENRVLTALQLGWNDIGDAGAGLLADALKENRVLTLLGLSENSISATGAASLLEALEKNHTLIHLNLFKNDIADKIVLNRINALLGRNRGLAQACHNAAKAGETEKCLVLLEQGVSPYGIRKIDGTEGSNSVLHEAILNGHVATVEALLKYYQKHDYPIDTKSAKGLTPQQLAEEQGDRELIDLFSSSSSAATAAAGGSVSAAVKNLDSKEEMPDPAPDDTLNKKLAAAARAGDVKRGLKLLVLGADIETTDTDEVIEGKEVISNRQYRPLHWAVRHQNPQAIEFVKMLLRQRAEIESQDGDGNTALEIASALENNEIVELLMDRLRASVAKAAGDDDMTEDKEYYFERGEVLCSLGRYEKADEAFDKALEIENRYAAAWYYKGLICGSIGKQGEKLKYYENACEVEPDNNQYQVERARVLHLLGRHEDAHAVIDDHLKRYDTDSYAMGWKTYFHMSEKNYEEALKCHERMCELEPAAKQNHVGRGETLYKLGRTQEARTAFDEALKLTDNLATEWNLRGAFYLREKDYEESLRCVEKACEIEPERALAHSNIAHVLNKLKRHKEAREACDRVLELEPDNAAALKMIEDIQTDAVATAGVSETGTDARFSPTLIAIVDHLKAGTLTKIDFFNHDVGDVSVKLLSAAFKENGVLTILALGDNFIGDTGVESLSDALRANRVLTTLSLEHNFIGDVGAKLLLEVLENNYALTELDLSGNKITHKTVLASIGKCLKRNQDLAQECHDAAKAGDTQKCLALLDKGVSPYAITHLAEGEADNSFLHWAVLNEHAATVEALLGYYHKHGYQVSLENAEGLTPLQMAEKQEDRELMALFSSSSSAAADNAEALELEKLTHVGNNFSSVSPEVFDEFAQSLVQKKIFSLFDLRCNPRGGASTETTEKFFRTLIQVARLMVIDLNDNEFSEDNIALFNQLLESGGNVTLCEVEGIKLSEKAQAVLSRNKEIHDLIEAAETALAGVNASSTQEDNEAGASDEQSLLTAHKEAIEKYEAAEAKLEDIDGEQSSAKKEELQANVKVLAGLRRCLAEAPYFTTFDLGNKGLGAASVEVVSALTSGLSQSPHVTVLALKGNGFGAASVEVLSALVTGLAQAPHLEALSFWGSSLGAASVEVVSALTRCLAEAPHLTELGLGNNGLGAASVDVVSALMDGLSQLPHLERLYFETNNLGAASAEVVSALTSGLAQAPHLTELNLGNNGLDAASTEIIEVLFRALVHTLKLKTIDISHNNFNADSVALFNQLLESDENITLCEVKGIKLSEKAQVVLSRNKEIHDLIEAAEARLRIVNASSTQEDNEAGASDEQPELTAYKEAIEKYEAAKAKLEAVDSGQANVRKEELQANVKVLAGLTRCLAEAPYFTTHDLGNNGLGAASVEVVSTLTSGLSQPHLTMLDFRHNEFGAASVEVLSALATGLAQSPYLTTLNLEGNGFGAASVGVVSALMDGLSRAPHLKELFLGGNRLGAASVDVVSALTQGLSQVPHLTRLELVSNGLGEASAEVVSALTSGLAQSPHLKELYLGNNDLDASSAEVVSALMDGLSRAPHLTELYLGNNGLGAASVDVVSALAQGLSQVPHLTTLDLGWNKLGEVRVEVMSALMDGLSRAAHLTDLKLDSNGLGAVSKEVISALMAGLRQVPNFTTLDLKWNGLGKASVEVISALTSGLAQSPHLTDLKLDSNGLGAASVDVASALMDGLAQSPHLTDLNLDSNGLGAASVDVVSALAQGLAEAPHLTTLRLGLNGLGAASVDVVSALTSGLAQLPHLTRLSLWGNGLGEASVSVVSALTSGLAQSPHLTELYLAYNGLGAASTEIIEVLFGAVVQTLKLTTIDISNNNFNADSVTLFNQLLESDENITLCEVKGIKLSEKAQVVLSRNKEIHDLIEAAEAGLRIVNASSTEEDNEASESDEQRLLTALDEVIADLKAAKARLKVIDSEQAIVKAEELRVNVKVLTTLTRALAQAPHLTELDLGNNELGQARVEVLSLLMRGLVRLPHLTELNLGGNELDAARVTALMSSLAKLPHLTKLGLGGSLSCVSLEWVVMALPRGYNPGVSLIPDSVEVLTALMDGLAQLLHLTTLNLSGNGFGVAPVHGLSALTHGLARVPNLKALDLGRNWLGCAKLEVITALTSGLAQVPYLTMLDLGGNELGTAGVEVLSTLTRGLARLPHLKELKLGGNELGAARVNEPGAARVEVLTALMDGLAQLPHLRTLDLGGNGFGEVSADLLTVLMGPGVQASTETIKVLFRAVVQTLKLTTLNLNNNNFSNDSVALFNRLLESGENVTLCEVKGIELSEEAQAVLSRNKSASEQQEKETEITVVTASETNAEVITSRFQEHKVYHDGWCGVYAIGAEPDEFIETLRQAIKSGDIGVLKQIGKAIVANMHNNQIAGEQARERSVLRDDMDVASINSLFDEQSRANDVLQAKVAALNAQNDKQGDEQLTSSDLLDSNLLSDAERDELLALKDDVVKITRTLKEEASSPDLCENYLSGIARQKYADAILLQAYVNFKGKGFCSIVEHVQGQYSVGNDYELAHANTDDVFVIYRPGAAEGIATYDRLELVQAKANAASADSASASGEQTNADRALGWNEKGLVYYSEGNYAEALRCYENAFKYELDHKVYHHNRGDALYRLGEGRYEEAHAAFDRVLELDEKHANAWNKKGLVYYSEGNYGEALRCYENACEYEHDNKVYHRNRGDALYRLGEDRYKEAHTAFDSALELDKKYADAWNLKGVVYYFEEKYAEALSCFENACKYSPGNKKFQNNFKKTLSKCSYLEISQYLFPEENHDVVKDEADAISSLVGLFSKKDVLERMLQEHPIIYTHLCLLKNADNITPVEHAIAHYPDAIKPFLQNNTETLQQCVYAFALATEMGAFQWLFDNLRAEVDACVPAVVGKSDCNAAIRAVRDTFTPAQPVAVVAASHTDSGFTGLIQHINQIERQAPADIAVMWGDETLSYQQLEQQSNQLAHYLKAQRDSRGKSLGEEQVVRIYLDEFNPNIIIAMLAIWKAGVAFSLVATTVDQAQQEHRLKDDNDQTQQRDTWVITDNSHKAGLPTGFKCLNLDKLQATLKQQPYTALESDTKATDLAYIAFTSGSSGMPKGVAINHAGLLPCFDYARQQLKLNRNDRVGQFSTLAFDAFIWDVMLALSGGACVVLKDDSLRNGNLANIPDFCERYGVTVVTLVPSVYQFFDPTTALNNVKLLSIGEKANSEWLDTWLAADQTRAAFDGYGLTETTIAALVGRYIAGNNSGLNIDVIPSLKFYLRDGKNGKVYPLNADCPEIEEGELLIAGDGLARGYMTAGMMDKEKTANKFKLIDAPESEEASATLRVYETGDIYCWQKQAFIYLRRDDGQLKIAGERIEAESAEALIKGALADKIDFAIDDVFVTENSSGQLAAYLVIDPEQFGLLDEIELEPAELRQWVKATTTATDKRIPSHFHVILTAEKDLLTTYQVKNNSGKILRKRTIEAIVKHLEDEGCVTTLTSSVAEAQGSARTETEQQLYVLWKEVLKLDGDFSLDDALEDLSCSSVNWSALQLRIEEQFKLSPPSDAKITIRQLAKIVDDKPKQDLGVLYSPAVEATGTVMTVNAVQPTKYLFLIHPITGGTGEFRELSNKLNPTVLAAHSMGVYAYRSPLLADGLKSDDLIFADFESMRKQARVAIETFRRYQPYGPYYLCGWSYGGILTLEIVRQLKEQGQKVAYVGLIDSRTPAEFQLTNRRLLAQRIIGMLNWFSKDCVSEDFFPEGNGKNFIRAIFDEALSQIDDLKLERVIRAARTHFIAAYGYQLDPEALTDVTVYLADDVDERYGARACSVGEWSGFCKASPTEAVLDKVNHFSIVTADKFAAILLKHIVHAKEYRLTNKLWLKLQNFYQQPKLQYLHFLYADVPWLVSECQFELRQTMPAVPTSISATEFNPWQEKGKQHVLLVSDGGMGKTTLCKHLTLAAMNNPQHWQKKWVFYISLPDVAKICQDTSAEPIQSIPDLLHRVFFQHHAVTLEEVEVLWSVIRKQPEQLCFIIDAMDEVAHIIEQQTDLKNVLKAIFALDTAVMLATRPYYLSTLTALGFNPIQRYENQALVGDKVVAYVERFFEHAGEPAKAERLQGYLAKQPRIAYLCRTPTYAALLCAIWRRYAEQLQTADSFLALLDIAVPHLLRDYLSRQASEGQDAHSVMLLSHHEVKTTTMNVKTCLERLAYACLIAETNVIPREQLEITLNETRQEPLLLAKLLASGLIVPLRHAKEAIYDDYRFVSPVFVDYFAARYARNLLLADNESDEMVDVLLNPKRDVLSNVCFSELAHVDETFREDLFAKLARWCSNADNTISSGSITYLANILEPLLVSDETVLKHLDVKMVMDFIGPALYCFDGAFADKPEALNSALVKIKSELRALRDTCPTVMQHANEKYQVNYQGNASVLHYPVITGNIALLEFLLAQEAPVNVRDDAGRRAIDIAIRDDMTEALKCLIPVSNLNWLNVMRVAEQLTDEQSRSLRERDAILTLDDFLARTNDLNTVPLNCSKEAWALLSETLRQVQIDWKVGTLCNSELVTEMDKVALTAIGDVLGHSYTPKINDAFNTIKLKFAEIYLDRWAGGEDSLDRLDEILITKLDEYYNTSKTDTVISEYIQSEAVIKATLFELLQGHDRVDILDEKTHEFFKQEKHRFATAYPQLAKQFAMVYRERFGDALQTKDNKKQVLNEIMASLELDVEVRQDLIRFYKDAINASVYPDVAIRASDAKPIRIHLIKQLLTDYKEDNLEKTFAKDLRILFLDQCHTAFEADIIEETAQDCLTQYKQDAAEFLSVLKDCLVNKLFQEVNERLNAGQQQLIKEQPPLAALCKTVSEMSAAVNSFPDKENAQSTDVASVRAGRVSSLEANSMS